MKKEDIRKEWEDFVSNDKYKEYFMDNEEEWKDNLEKVKKYINTNNKRPSAGNKNKEELKNTYFHILFSYF